MELNDQTKVLLIVVLAFALFYFYSNSSQTEGFDNNQSSTTYDPDMAIDITDQTDDMADDSNPDEKLVRRMRGKNASKNGYKSSSYKDGQRGGSSDGLDKFFEQGNQFEADNQDYVPSNDGNNLYAAYESSGNNRNREEDKFNSGDFLPKETNNDWFEDVQAVKVKNRNLINVFRPTGIDTINASKKVAGLDIRGTPPNPRTIVSPFLNSSVDPDYNIKGLC
uniref:Minor capsid protein P11 C-terminal conserved region domain-containing protein n=1 Tax=viral metagenome TaxID=1070528 RepID=A0A6C0EBP5_9ZZZZ